MRSWITLAALVVVVVALGAWIYHKPPQREAETYALSTLTSKDVKRIELERAASNLSAPRSQPDDASQFTASAGQRAEIASASSRAPAIVVERQGESWRMTAPVSARVDAFQVDRLLSILEARSAARYSASDLARFGLESPIAALKIADQQFAYGAINTTTREQYVLTQNAVYAVPLAHTAGLPRDADALIARELFAAGETPVRFELPGFSVSLENGAWTVTPPGEASADDRAAWADTWRRAIAMQAARYDGRTPAGEIKVSLKDGKTLGLGILQHEPELVLWRADEGVQYYFIAEVGKRMLTPPKVKE